MAARRAVRAPTAAAGSWEAGGPSSGSTATRPSSRARGFACACRSRDCRGPLRPGAAVSLRLPKELPSLSPGFCTAIGDADAGAEPVRPCACTGTSTRAGAPPLVARAHLATERAHGVPFRLKVADHPSRLERCDAAVLYLPREAFGAAACDAPRGRALASRLRPRDPGLHARARARRRARRGRRRRRELRRPALRAARRRDRAGARAAHGRTRSTSWPAASPRRASTSTRRTASRRWPVAMSSDAFLDAAAAIGRRIVADAIWYDGLLQLDRRRSSRSMPQPCGAPRARAESLRRHRRHRAVPRPPRPLATAMPPPVARHVGALRHAVAARRAAATGSTPGRSASRGRPPARPRCSTRTSCTSARTVRSRGLSPAAAPTSSSAPPASAARAARARPSVDDAGRRRGEALLAARPRDAGTAGHGRAGAARRHLCGLSHGAAGIGWALLELFAATGDERFRDGAEGAFAYERSWLDPRVGHVARPADRRPAPRDAAVGPVADRAARGATARPGIALDAAARGRACSARSRYAARGRDRARDRPAASSPRRCLTRSRT